jgi:hypothetical protein
MKGNAELMKNLIKESKNNPQVKEILDKALKSSGLEGKILNDNDYAILAQHFNAMSNAFTSSRGLAVALSETKTLNSRIKTSEEGLGSAVQKEIESREGAIIGDFAEEYAKINLAMKLDKMRKRATTSLLEIASLATGLGDNKDIVKNRRLMNDKIKAKESRVNFLENKENLSKAEKRELRRLKKDINKLKIEYAELKKTFNPLAHVDDKINQGTEKVKEIAAKAINTSTAKVSEAGKKVFEMIDNKYEGKASAILSKAEIAKQKAILMTASKMPGGKVKLAYLAEQVAIGAISYEVFADPNKSFSENMLDLAEMLDPTFVGVSTIRNTYNEIEQKWDKIDGVGDVAYIAADNVANIGRSTARLLGWDSSTTEYYKTHSVGDILNDVQNIDWNANYELYSEYYGGIYNNIEKSVTEKAKEISDYASEALNKADNFYKSTKESISNSIEETTNSIIDTFNETTNYYKSKSSEEIINDIKNTDLKETIETVNDFSEEVYNTTSNIASTTWKVVSNMGTETYSHFSKDKSEEEILKDRFIK